MFNLHPLSDSAWAQKERCPELANAISTYRQNDNFKQFKRNKNESYGHIVICRYGDL